MTTTIYVPRDATALSRGADKVARAITEEASRRNVDVKIVRNGSRGMFRLEPLVEVATPAGRIAYGPVTPQDVTDLFDTGFEGGAAHRLHTGTTRSMQNKYQAAFPELAFRPVKMKSAVMRTNLY